MAVFRMPSLGADMEAGTLVEWLVKPGDTVSRGDVVAVVETQKGAIEIEIFETGVVHELTAGLGAELPVGAPLAVILAEGEAPPQASQPQPAPGPSPGVTARDTSASSAPTTDPADRPAPQPGTPMASPAARVRARDLGVDLSGLSGSGPNGAILLADVENRGRRPARPTADASAQPASPMAEMRKAIAAAMTRSKQTIPHFYLSHTIDLSPAVAFLNALNAGRSPTARILMGALFVRAVTRALVKVPVLNGHYGDDGFRPSATINPGIAVALRGGGLVAPALMDAQAMDLDQTMAEMRDLVSRARAGRLRGSEMTQGTITISSLGETGADAMGGIIFPPQVALIGIGAPRTRPWVVDGQVVPREVVTITVSADHRVCDGRQAAKLIAEFETQMQTPDQL